MIATRNDCAEYINSDDAAMEHAKTFCASQSKAVFSTGGCPKENLIGVCQLGTIKHYRYSRGAETLTAEKAKKDCAGPGDWKPAD